MGSPQAAPMEFNRGEEILPATSPGVTSLGDFQRREAERKRLELMKSRGLTEEEIRLYRDRETGAAGRSKMEEGVMREKLQHIFSKLESASDGPLGDDAQPSTSKTAAGEIFSNIQKKSTSFYPDQHPMNSIKDLERDMFDHIKVDTIAPITKRRKMLRRLHRKKESLMYETSKVGIQNVPISNANQNPNSLWDIKDVPNRSLELPHIEKVSSNKTTLLECSRSRKRMLGPKQQVRYTIKNKKIVRLEPVQREEGNAPEEQDYRAVDIIVPVNPAEERLLEGTKLSVDQIRSMERFKHYHPGKPSKVLFLKNISPAAVEQDVSILFNQFVHENRAPIHVRLMSGRLRGQAFVHFQHENVAIQALEDVNGTVVKGRPVIVQFGKNSNNLQNDNR